LLEFPVAKFAGVILVELVERSFEMMIDFSIAEDISWIDVHHGSNQVVDGVLDVALHVVEALSEFSISGSSGVVVAASICKGILNHGVVLHGCIKESG